VLWTGFPTFRRVLTGLVWLKTMSGGELAGYIKRAEFLDSLNDYHLVKKDFSPCSESVASQV
jgi:hypothetical protein